MSVKNRLEQRNVTGIVFASITATTIANVTRQLHHCHMTHWRLFREIISILVSQVVTVTCDDANDVWADDERMLHDKR